MTSLKSPDLRMIQVKMIFNRTDPYMVQITDFAEKSDLLSVWGIRDQNRGELSYLNHSKNHFSENHPYQNYPKILAFQMCKSPRNQFILGWKKREPELSEPVSDPVVTPHSGGIHRFRH